MCILTTMTNKAVFRVFWGTVYCTVFRMVEFPWKKAVWQGLLCKSPSGLASRGQLPTLWGAFFRTAEPSAESLLAQRGGGRVYEAGGAFTVRGGGRPRRGQDPSLRGKRQKGGTGKVEGRACPAPTDCPKWGADERGKGGRQPSLFPVDGLPR